MNILIMLDHASNFYIRLSSTYGIWSILYYKEIIHTHNPATNHSILSPLFFPITYVEYSFDWHLKVIFLRQQGGIIVAGPGKSNISYIHRVSFPYFPVPALCVGKVMV